MIAQGRSMASTGRWALRRMTRVRGHVAGYIGGHGGENLGDNLMLDLAQRLLPRWRLADYAESWHEKRLARLGLSGARYFQHVLLGGGTLISPFWYGKVEAAVKQGLPIATLGTGVGSCGFIQPDGIDLSNWAPLLRAFEHLGVRGPRSVKRLEAMGVTHAQVVGDLALYLTHDRPMDPAPTPTVAVNLSLPAEGDPQHGEAQRFEELLHTLLPYIKQGWAIRPYAMNPVDIEPTRHLVERLGRSDAAVPLLDSVPAFFEYVGPATVNIAVRLHGAILGCCVGVPPVILGYREKCLDFAESLYLRKWCVYLPEAQMGDVAITTASAIDSATDARQRIIARALSLKQCLIDYARRIAPEPR